MLPFMSSRDINFRTKGNQSLARLYRGYVGNGPKAFLNIPANLLELSLSSAYILIIREQTPRKW